MKKIIISAVAKNGVIGRSNGEMPWHAKEEFKHFKDTTFGFPIIMGRKTFESLGKPLKGRLNVVITSNLGFKLYPDEIKVFHSLNEAVSYFSSKGLEKIFIIGGGEIYKQAISFADEMVISFMDFEAEGDIFFPEINKNAWEIDRSDKRGQFEIVYYVRNINDKN